MKVILLDYVYKHGVAGEVIDVADGFARNFLIPKGLAVKASPGEMKRATKLREQAVAKRAALENRLNELAQEIEGVELIFERRAAITGKLFGSVTTQEIADALLEKTGIDINRRRISQQSLREVGTHEVAIRLGTENSPNIYVTIVREGEMEEFLQARAAGETAAEAAAATAAESDDDVEGDAPAADDDVMDAENMATEVMPRSQMQAELDAISAAQDAENTDDAPPAAEETPDETD